MIASIGKSTNNVVLKEQTNAEPWDRLAYIVITSDAEMAEEITDELVSAGATAKDIFTEPVLPDLVRVGSVSRLMI